MSIRSLGMTNDRPHNPSAADQSPANELGSLSDNLIGMVLECLPTGLVVFDRDLRELLRNHAARAMLPPEGDISRAISRVAIESKYEDWGAEFRRVIDTGLPQRLGVTIKGAGDQPDVYLDLAVNPVRAAETGDVIGGLILMDNNTARIGMERRLAVSERLAAVGKLAARVAHELNNPLDGILRYINLALRLIGENADPKLPQYLGKAKSGIVRMCEIITTLLEFSRSAPVAFEPATINKIVEDALSARRAGRGRRTFRLCATSTRRTCRWCAAATSFRSSATWSRTRSRRCRTEASTLTTAGRASPTCCKAR